MRLRRIERLTDTGPAVITIEAGATVEVVRQRGTRVEVVRPS
jgi:hypothetical protein